jgi:hypothetical protein
MKSISKLVFSIFLSSFMFLNAQEDKLDKSLTFEDAVYLNKSIFPKRLNMLQWQQNSRNYTYTSNRNVIQKSADNATTFDTILGLEDFVPLK